jgi:hypothetical protein
MHSRGKLVFTAGEIIIYVQTTINIRVNTVKYCTLHTPHQKQKHSCVAFLSLNGSLGCQSGREKGDRSLEGVLKAVHGQSAVCTDRAALR